MSFQYGKFNIFIQSRLQSLSRECISLILSLSVFPIVIIPRDPLNGFGLRYKRNKITFLKYGFPADKTDKIEIGDEILYINGTYIGDDVNTSKVTSLMEKSQKSVTIIFQRGSVV